MRAAIALACLLAAGSSAAPAPPQSGPKAPPADNAQLMLTFVCADGKPIGVQVVAPEAGTWTIPFDHVLCHPDEPIIAPAETPAPRRARPQS